MRPFNIRCQALAMNNIIADPIAGFYRKSKTESICMYCYGTVRGDRFITLEQAQELHSIACLMRPASSLSFWRE